MKTLMSLILLISGMSFSASASELTFEQFKDSCLNPAAYGHQNPPSKIKLLCKNAHTAWEEVDQGQASLMETRQFSSTLISNKYTIGTRTYRASVPSTAVMCPRYQQVQRTASIETVLTCDSILNSGMSLEELCLERLDASLLENPGLEAVVATGAMFSPCDGDAAPQNQGGISRVGKE